MHELISQYTNLLWEVRGLSGRIRIAGSTFQLCSLCQYRGIAECLNADLLLSILLLICIVCAQAEADEFAASAAAAAAGKPLPPQPDMTNRTPQQIPMNQSRGSTLTDSRSGSVAGSRGSTLEKPAPDVSEVAASLPLQAAVEPPNYPLQPANQVQHFNLM